MTGEHIKFVYMSLGLPGRVDIFLLPNHVYPAGRKYRLAYGSCVVRAPASENLAVQNKDNVSVALASSNS